MTYQQCRARLKHPSQQSKAPVFGGREVDARDKGTHVDVQRPVGIEFEFGWREKALPNSV